MPRKRNHPRKPGATSRVTTPRAKRTSVSPNQSHLRDGLDRHRRPDMRPPKFPGRQGGR